MAMDSKVHINIIQHLSYYSVDASYLYDTSNIAFLKRTGVKKVDTTCNKKNQQRRFLHDELHGDDCGYE